MPLRSSDRRQPQTNSARQSCESSSEEEGHTAGEQPPVAFSGEVPWGEASESWLGPSSPRDQPKGQGGCCLGLAGSQALKGARFRLANQDVLKANRILP